MKNGKKFEMGVKRKVGKEGKGLKKKGDKANPKFRKTLKASKPANKPKIHAGATQQWIVEDDEDENTTMELSGVENLAENSDSDNNDDNAPIAPSQDSTTNFNFDDDSDVEDDPSKIVRGSGEDLEIGDLKTLDLMQTVREMIPTKRFPMKRKEAAKNVEEFGTIKRRVMVGEGGMNKFLESVKEVGDTKTVEKVAKLQAATENEKTAKSRRIKTLDAPAERITSEKVKRTVLYDHAKEEVSKWNSVVYHNRAAEQLVFPLSEDKKAFKKPQRNKDGTEFVPVTPLEEEIAKVLYGEDYVQRKKAEMSKDPGKTDMESYLLSVEEAMATHSEMAKLRALQSYAMSKAKRQNKIKSKKYHRLLRKSKIKLQMKEFEELQKKDPEAAMVKLEELEKARVQERMSLKHRNTSKWAKMQAARAKYDKDSRMALSEQLKISRDLTQKVQESSDSEDDENMELPLLVKSSVENPWMLKPSLQENEKLQMYYTGYKKFWEEYNSQMQKKQNKTTEEGDDVVESSEESGSGSESEENESDNNEGKIKKANRNTDGDADEFREVIVNEEEINTESVNETGETNFTSHPTKKVAPLKKNDDNGTNKVSLEVDPDKFLKITKSNSSIVPQFNAENSKVVDLLEESEDSDDETDQRNLIAEAFEDDDVVNEFQKQKKDTVEASQPQDLDNFLPGWGSWAGKDIVANPTKKKRFVKKAKKGPPRKDARASHVIINEAVDDKVRTHQVKELPFPFTRVKDFEKIVRAPIGRTWMPESAVKSLTAPKVITRLGQIIKPISDDVLAKPKEQTFNVPSTILRMAKVSSKK